MTIAILAHDSRKELALQFCTAYSAILSRNNVIATGTTGRMLAQTTGLPVHCYLSGLRELSEGVIEKLKLLTDAEFAELEFPPD